MKRLALVFLAVSASAADLEIRDAVDSAPPPPAEQVTHCANGPGSLPVTAAIERLSATCRKVLAYERDRTMRAYVHLPVAMRQLQADQFTCGFWYRAVIKPGMCEAALAAREAGR